MLLKKLGVNALLPMLCRLRFSKSFQSDNHFRFFYLVLSEPFSNSEIVLVVIVYN